MMPQPQQQFQPMPQQYAPQQQYPSTAGFDFLKLGVVLLMVGSFVMGAGIIVLSLVTNDITVGNFRTSGGYGTPEYKMDITLPGFSIGLAILGVAVMLNGIGTALTMYGLRNR